MSKLWDLNNYFNEIEKKLGRSVDVRKSEEMMDEGINIPKAVQFFKIYYEEMYKDKKQQPNKRY